MKLSRSHRTVAGALLLVPAMAWAQASFAAMHSIDKNFVMNAAMGGLAEVELGKLAQVHAQSALVREFGTRMVDDHGKAVDELVAIAHEKGLTPPADLDAAHRKSVERMRALSGANFDHAFMSQMLADHRKTIAAFEAQSTSGKDDDIKAYAAKTLPTLRSHLEMAQHTSEDAAHSV